MKLFCENGRPIRVSLECRLRSHTKDLFRTTKLPETFNMVALFQSLQFVLYHTYVSRNLVFIYYSSYVLRYTHTDGQTLPMANCRSNLSQRKQHPNP